MYVITGSMRKVSLNSVFIYGGSVMGVISTLNISTNSLMPLSMKIIASLSLTPVTISYGFPTLLNTYTSP